MPWSRKCPRACILPVRGRSRSEIYTFEQPRLSRTCRKLYLPLVLEVWRHLRIPIQARLEEEEQGLTIARRANGGLWGRLQVIIKSPRSLMQWIQQLTISLETREYLPQNLALLAGERRLKKALSGDIHSHVGGFMGLMPNLSNLNNSGLSI